MIRAVSYLPLALLFLASAVPSNGQMRRSEAEGGADSEVSVKLGAPLTVECPLRPEQVAEWKRNGGDIPRDMKVLEAPDKKSPDALTARLTAPAAMAHHAGVYTCAKASPRIKVKVTDTESTTVIAEELPRAAADFNGEVQYFEVRSANFQLNCSIGGAISWKKNDTAIEKFPELNGRLVSKVWQGVENAQLTISGRATEDDFGNYTCENSAGKEQNWIVMARPHAKLPTDSNVVEGQKLKLTCKIIGRPHPVVQWTYSNSSEQVINGTEAREFFGDRVKLVKSDQGVEDGDLIIDSALRSDAGWYKCTPLADAKANATTAVTRLRVKDMYAALWPFLGICAEVFILCAIILVYEKRRTKPELDDSDTDNHDQKKS